MVGGTVVLLAIAFVDIVRGDDEPDPRPTAQQVVGTPTAAPTDTVVIGPRKAGKGKGKGRGRGSGQAIAPSTPVAPPLAEPDGACADPDVVVAPVMANAVAGRPVLVTLHLRTIDAAACTWTIDRQHLAYVVTDGDGDDVWSSSQCPGQLPSDEIVVRRDVSTTYRMAWSGRYSSRDCPVSMGYVEPGDYAVQTAAIGGEPSQVVPFVLLDPAELEPDGPVGPPVPETEEPAGQGQKKNENKSKNKQQQSDQGSAGR